VISRKTRDAGSRTVAVMTSGPAERARALVDLATQATTAYERPDLTNRLGIARLRLDDRRVRVVTIGQFKHGKSSLINALLGIEVCPIDDDVATSTPTVVQWAPEFIATAVFRSEDAGEPRREQIAVADLPEFVTESGNPDNRRELALVEIGLPATLLQDGLALVDTPGVGGLGSIHSALTMATLPLADAVLFVTDAAQELTESELAHLRAVVRSCAKVLVVTTKVDLHPEWRKIHALDAMHLNEADLSIPQLACSSLLRELALESGDRSTNEESGFPALIQWLRDVVAADAQHSAAMAAADAVAEVAESLRAQFDTERAVLSNSEEADALVHSLDQAQHDVELARSAGGSWQKLLADGFADASADIDRDLRGRMRELNARAERSIDELEPSTAWSEFEPWLYQQTGSTVSDHLSWRHDRFGTWVDSVVVAFGETDGQVDHFLEVHEVDELLVATEGRAKLDVKRTRLGGQALSLLRSSYGGITMFGALGGIAGIVVATPAIVGMGLLLGGKGLREEKARQLAQRRAQAKVAVRQYLDEVNFALNNDQRDTLRAMQRSVRDHFAVRALEMTASSKAALDAATAAVRHDAAGRGARLTYVQAELAKIGVVTERAESLLSDLATADR
jgi:Dynamin family